MKLIDFLSLFSIFNLSGSNIVIKFKICEAEIIFICFARQSVKRDLFSQHIWKAEDSAQLFHLLRAG